jgi:hypothetical protein
VVILVCVCGFTLWDDSVYEVLSTPLVGRSPHELPHCLGQSGTAASAASGVRWCTLGVSPIRTGLEDGRLGPDVVHGPLGAVACPSDIVLRRAASWSLYPFRLFLQWLRLTISGLLALLGTGLFISSGTALLNGGPATLLIAYLLVGSMLYCVMQALGELSVVFPIAGSFSAYSTRFLDPAWGFAMGWK